MLFNDGDWGGRPPLNPPAHETVADRGGTRPCLGVGSNLVIVN